MENDPLFLSVLASGEMAAPRSPEAEYRAHILASFSRPVFDSPKAPTTRGRRTPCRQKPSCAHQNGPQWPSWPKPGALLANVISSFFLTLPCTPSWSAAGVGRLGFQHRRRSSSCVVCLAGLVIKEGRRRGRSCSTAVTYGSVCRVAGSVEVRHYCASCILGASPRGRVAHEMVAVTAAVMFGDHSCQEVDC